MMHEYVNVAIRVWEDCNVAEQRQSRVISRLNQRIETTHVQHRSNFVTYHLKKRRGYILSTSRYHASFVKMQIEFEQKF